MELSKINEAYNVSDELSNGWKTSGQVIREESGDLKINFSTQKDNLYVGNYSYVVYRGTDNVNINYSAPKGQDEEYHEYCDSLIDFILEQLDNNKSIV